MADKKEITKIGVVGAGWWSQGWHLPHLSRNEKAKIAAVVDISHHPQSNLDPNMESLAHLSERYQCPYYHSTEEMLLNIPDIEGVIVCTPHASHYPIGKFIVTENIRRLKEGDLPPIHVLMEKPMTTSVPQAKLLHDAVSSYRHAGGSTCFMINHSANFRTQAREAASLVRSGGIGTIRHVTGFMASPLIKIFDDPTNKGWNEPDGSEDMIGNGFAWGQSCHLLGWIYHVGGEELLPKRVFCAMNHSEKTGADVSHSATVICKNGINMAISGTTLLPGDHGPAVGKRISIKIFGTEGSILYIGDDMNKDSGNLEHHKFAKSDRQDSTMDLPCSDIGFHFENVDPNGTGPESLQNFLDACLGLDYYEGADTILGLKTIQTVDAMYRSHISGNVENILET